MVDDDLLKTNVESQFILTLICCYTANKQCLNHFGQEQNGILGCIGKYYI